MLRARIRIECPGDQWPAISSTRAKALADLVTIREHAGRLEGVRLAYVGDGNNVCHSLMLAGAAVGMHVTVVTPKGASP